LIISSTSDWPTGQQIRATDNEGSYRHSEVPIAEPDRAKIAAEWAARGFGCDKWTAHCSWDCLEDVPPGGA
jgi:hypothetical protein